jgi:hypothetical protein
MKVRLTQKHSYWPESNNSCCETSSLEPRRGVEIRVIFPSTVVPSISLPPTTTFQFSIAFHHRTLYSRDTALKSVANI